MTFIAYGGIAGIGAGAVLLFLSHLAPRIGAGNFVHDADRLRLFGRAYSRREAHLFGMIVHLSLSFLAGAIYAFGLQEGFVSGLQAVPLLVYAIILTVFFGGVLMPLEGHGLFGLKEDRWFPLDLLITNVLWVLLFGLSMSLWLPA